MATAGLLGPLAFLMLVGLNAWLLWRNRHALAGALVGRGFAAQVRYVSPSGEPNVIPLRVIPNARAVSARPPALRLAA